MTPRARPRLAEYLAHILEAIERINRYTAGLDEAGFLREALVQDAVIRNLEITGEAGHGIQRHHPEVVAAHPELPLEMRSAIAHGYFCVDLAIVWRTVRRDLPDLRRRVQGLAARLDQAGGGAKGGSR